MAKHRGRAFHHCRRRGEHQATVLRYGPCAPSIGRHERCPGRCRYRRPSAGRPRWRASRSGKECEHDASFQRPCHCQQAPGRVRARDALPGSCAVRHCWHRLLAGCKSWSAPRYGQPAPSGNWKVSFRGRSTSPIAPARPRKGGLVLSGFFWGVTEVGENRSALVCRDRSARWLVRTGLRIGPRS